MHLIPPPAAAHVAKWHAWQFLDVLPCLEAAPLPRLSLFPLLPQLSFLLLHQTKGSSLWQDQDAYDETIWEQVDSGRPWTPVKKVFLITPLILCVSFTYTVHE